MNHKFQTKTNFATRILESIQIRNVFSIKYHLKTNILIKKSLNNFSIKQKIGTKTDISQRKRLKLKLSETHDSRVFLKFI